MILHGKNLIIKVDGAPLAAAKSCRLSINAERYEVANPSDGKWRRFIWGRMSWSIQTNHLVTSVSRSAQMTGTTVSIEVGLNGSGIPFGGFVNGVTITTGTYSGTPGAIAWDKTNKQFLAVIYGSGTTSYYAAWTNDEAYTDPSPYDLFTFNGITYTWFNDDLSAEKLTGNADVLSWDCQGGVGNLATGAFELGGNGALTPAALP